MTAVDYGLDIAQHQLSWPELLRRARLAEDAGLTGVWVFDHFTALYGDPTGPCLEGWTLLAALAAATERVRIGALVTGATYRHPSLLAAEAVTVDHVSAGRLELAVGAAWHEGEHRALGFDFPGVPDRVRLLEETVEVLRLLMTEDDVTFDGDHVQLRDASYRPRPIQAPHPPIWIGAGGPQLTVPLAGRLADVWHTSGSTDRLRRLSSILDESAEAAGRDPADIRRATDLDLSQEWDEVRRAAEERAELGFGYLVLQWPSEGERRLEAFLEDVLPTLP
jgi:F420-dependent oxidoreductase-like protein